MSVVLRFLRLPGYFTGTIEGGIKWGRREDAVEFDSIASANDYREHRINLWETVIEPATLADIQTEFTRKCLITGLSCRCAPFTCKHDDTPTYRPIG